MNGKWIWYPGDFELYHALQVHSRREEGSCGYPAFWRCDDCWHSILLRRELTLPAPATLLIQSASKGYCELDGKKLPLCGTFALSEGCHTIELALINPSSLPSAYIASGEPLLLEGWRADNYIRQYPPAGENELCRDPGLDPSVFPFHYEDIPLQEKKQLPQGLLLDYGKETFAKVTVTSTQKSPIWYGESLEEATSESCYLRDEVYPGDNSLPVRAFRFLFFPGAGESDIQVQAQLQCLPKKPRGSFCCSNRLLNEIWQASAHTFMLNSQEFFFDGIKRDRWIWSGDAYQSYFINNYLCFDQNTTRRTIYALRGKDPVEQHINIIVDYSAYWIISIADYLRTTNDSAFVKQIFPRLNSLMQFCIGRLDENGLVVGHKHDWVFIDWAEFDREGPLCAEQMLFVQALRAMAQCCTQLGVDGMQYATRAAALQETIQRLYWCPEKGAYIDSFMSGRQNVTRHANIFALLFGIADESQRAVILENVLYNDAVEPIKTPYFNYYELEALCQTGSLPEVTDRILLYWGSMIENGATSIWEEYDPSLPMGAQYDMYGVPFAKSLCHAWGASPVYLLGRYYLGVYPTANGYESFTVAPQLGGLDWIEGTVPVGEGDVTIQASPSAVTVHSTAPGGTLLWQGQQYTIPVNSTLTLT